MKNKRGQILWLLIIFIVLALILLAGGFIFFKNITDVLGSKWLFWTIVVAVLFAFKDPIILFLNTLIGIAKAGGQWGKVILLAILVGIGYLVYIHFFT